METKEGTSSWRPMKLDEDAHFFDFIAFYKKVEFCDRSIQLEILEEYRKASKDGDAEMTDVPSGEAGVQSAAAASKGKGETLAEPATSMKEAEKGSEERLKSAEGSAEKANEPAADNSREAGVEEDASGGKESGSSEKQTEVDGTPPESGEKALEDQGNPLGGCEKAPEALEENEAWVEVIPVNSIVLAAKSCVLRTMLSNGMRESDASAPVVLKVTPQEKEAFKELLLFIYVGSLSPQFLRTDANIRELVDLLIVGDKFEVGSLMGAVLKAFAKRGRTISDSIVLALEIPDALEQHPKVKAVIKEARTHVVETFKDVESWAESLEFLTLKQVVVSFLLQSEELDAASEEDIFQGVLVWVRNNLEGTAKQGAMRDLSLHLRFGLMRGEFLLKQVLPLLEMALPAVQERVRPNALGMSWDEARKSSYYLNSTGELTVKIIVRNRKLLEEAEKDKREGP